jgi:hypothetical protein
LRTALPLLVALAATGPLTARAAELPAVFHGTWRIANPSDSTCRKDDVTGSAEGHIIVKADAIDQYESSCRIVSVRQTRKGVREPFSVAVKTACSGEGMRWRDRALWHLETVNGARLLAVTTINSAIHDERGRRMQARNLPATAIYAACR